MPLWSLITPPAAAALLGLSFALPPSAIVATLSALALVGAVLAAVHHAEVIAHRIGEPFGTLVLALAVTLIELALILSLMLAGGASQAALPRDTIFATLMIVCNGIVGLCLVVGGLRHHEQAFSAAGTNAFLATLIAMSTLTLVLPAFTTSSPGPTYTPAQLGFAAVMSLLLWSVFVLVQTGRHRDYFLPVGAEGASADLQQHAPPPSTRESVASLVLLLLALVAVVGLAKRLSPGIKAGLEAIGAPAAVLAVAIAILVLLPETLAAVRAARANRLQTSFNLAYGSGLASIGLTIPAVAAASVALGLPLVLGIEAKDLVLLAVTFLVSAVTLASGRSHVMLGTVHLVIFSAFLFLALVP